MRNPSLVALVVASTFGSAPAEQTATAPPHDGVAIEVDATGLTLDPRIGTRPRRGVLRVPEARDEPGGRVLELDVVVLPATGPDPQPDPVFFLAGGPGQAATEFAVRIDWSGLRRARDVVLVDQRGTGGSHRLQCATAESNDDPRDWLDPLFDAETIGPCLQALMEEADLTRYTTPIAMDDLDDLRAALGYDRINVMGGSYGTRAALVYLRRHPEHVRTLILNGVAPIAFTNPLYHASEAQAALDAIIAECAADPACNSAFGDLADEFDALLRQLDAEPAEVEIADPRGGPPVRVTMTRDAFAETLRMMMYADSRRVPLLLHRAARGDLVAFAEHGIAASLGIRGSLSLGMLLCVVCNEDVPRIDPADIVPLTDGTFLGPGRVRRQMAVCDLWPRAELPAEYGDPVTSDAAVLILSGTLDPVTSARWGAEAAGHLSGSLHVVAPGAHGVGGPCIEGIIDDFLDAGTVDGLDVSCVERMSLGPFELPD